MQFLLLLLAPMLSSALSLKKVAIIGPTGQLGRQAVIQLSKAGVATRCLLRYDVRGIEPPTSLTDATTSAQVAAYLGTLPGVEFVRGDCATDKDSLLLLLDGCDACLALHGAVAPKPWFRALFWYPESLATHPKQVNYVAVQNLIEALAVHPMRLVRITGKGENPWSLSSMLINVFSGVAKGWNYESEQLLRKSNVDYTILRPGIKKNETAASAEQLGLLDNGRDLPVTVVSYSQIAELAIAVAGRDNCKRATLTAMNVKPDAELEYQTLEQVQTDTRVFPDSLLVKHKKAALVGRVLILGSALLLIQWMVTVAGKLLGLAA
jgi:hypothetical protein